MTALWQQAVSMLGTLVKSLSWEGWSEGQGSQHNRCSVFDPLW